jgi:hypothetical protein
MGVIILGNGSPDHLKKSNFFKLNVHSTMAKVTTDNVSSWLAERLDKEHWDIRYNMVLGHLVIRIDDAVVATEFYLTIK